MSRRLFALAFWVGGSTACWPGWTALFDQTPSQEHEVSDLRVLAIEVEPASITVPSGMAWGDDDGPINLRVRPRVFDPRGGRFALSLRLCGLATPGARCGGRGVFVTERSVEANPDAPLGAADVDIPVTLTRADIAQLFADGGIPWPSLGALAVDIEVGVSRDVGGVAEREVATLPVQLRVDPEGEEVPADALLAVSLTRCASLSDDALCGGTRVGSCGDEVLQPGESCDPPAVDLCSDECLPASLCGSRVPLVCTRPVLPNQRPRLLGLSRTDDVFSSLADVEPDLAPGDTVRGRDGDLLTLVPVTRSSDAESRPTFQTTVEGFEGGPPGPQPVDDAVTTPEGPGCVVPSGYGCPQTETISARYYVGGSGSTLVAPADDTGHYVGNGDGGLRGFTVRLSLGGGAKNKQPLVVVLSDGTGGMDVASFTLDVSAR